MQQNEIEKEEREKHTIWNQGKAAAVVGGSATWLVALKRWS